MSFLTSQPIDVTALAASVTTAHDGAVVTFAGLVRDHHAGRSVVSLGYSAYAGMAEQVCGDVCHEVSTRWPVQVALQHRIGELAIGDCAIGVAVASAHRQAAFEACRWVVDEVKRRAPIWKRERYADGAEAWVDPTAPGGVAINNE
jgi:molybdopterin synthase catalytic subunit